MLAFQTHFQRTITGKGGSEYRINRKVGLCALS